MNSFETKQTLKIGNQTFNYHSLPVLEKKTNKDLSKLPFSLKILLENLLRNEDGVAVKKADIDEILNWKPKDEPSKEIQFTPARVILQDFTGVPAVCDLAAMREALKKMGGNPDRINPLQPAALVIDHSVQVDHFGSKDALEKNEKLEFDRNTERYLFLKWGQKAFKNFQVVPPATGIVHQVNLEFLSYVAMTANKDGSDWIYPDTLVGTDSHTTMINGLGVLGWGVGGIEAEAALLGQPSTMLIPQVIGFKLKGKLPAGSTATDLVLTVTQILRKKNVVGKFVEFYGEGLTHLSLADRATIANMAPEYGATIGIFPVDEQTTNYLRLTNRADHAEKVEKYFKEQGLWWNPKNEPQYTDTLELDLKDIVPSIAGPARPQDRVELQNARKSIRQVMATYFPEQTKALGDKYEKWVKAEGSKTEKTQELEPRNDGVDFIEKVVEVDNPNGDNFNLAHGSVVIAAITSCTNTSNPSVMLAAGLLAKNAVSKGLKVKPWVKTSLAPGSKVVTEYLIEAGLLDSLASVGFDVVGYGCTTCIGNSGPLPEHISKSIEKENLAVCAVLSGNRNFEGRINPNVRANYLASPPLVVAYALAGNLNLDLTKSPVGYNDKNEAVYLKDIWPSLDEVNLVVEKCVTQKLYQKSYTDVFKGSAAWQKIQEPKGDLYSWEKNSTYIKKPNFWEDVKETPTPLNDINNAAVLGFFGDSVTTDHISPAGNIGKSSPAGKYLIQNGVDPKDFNSYGARRGNHEVMVRGTFANIRIKNKLVPGTEGGVTIFHPSNEQMPIYEASMKYQEKKTALIVLAGKEYGTGSSRDWAAKGTKLLGIQCVIAESFERIHRSNLVGMGVLPLQFKNGESASSLGLTGKENFTIRGIISLKPLSQIDVEAKDTSGKITTFKAHVRIDTPNELEYYKHGGILTYVLRQIHKKH